jgi:hypothetical protein
VGEVLAGGDVSEGVAAVAQSRAARKGRPREREGGRQAGREIREGELEKKKKLRLFSNNTDSAHTSL